MDSTLRPMSTSQVLDRTFNLYKSNFLLFAGISSLPPVVILLWQLSSVLFAFTLASERNVVGSEITLVAGVIALVIGYLAALAFATGATVYAVSRLHLGHQVNIAESYKIIRPLLWRIIGIVVSVALRFAGALMLTVFAGAIPMVLMRMIGPASVSVPIIVITLTVAAVIVCVIWSLRVYCSYQLAVPACVLEKLGATACLKRSRFLSKGKGVQRILLVLFLCAILTYALAITLSVPIFISVGLGVATRNLGLSLPLVIWQYLSSFIAGAVAGPVVTIAVSLLYYDERVRKEAFDLQLMMEAMGEASPASSAIAAAPGAIG